MINKLFSCLQCGSIERQNNSISGQEEVQRFKLRRVRSHKPDLFTTLPVELQLNIAESLPYPALLSLRTVNRHMLQIIDIKMLDTAKSRITFEFQKLQKPERSEANGSSIETALPFATCFHCNGQKISLLYDKNSHYGVMGEKI